MSRYRNVGNIAEVVKKRNQTVDIMRGIAMLMVVLEHTMTSCTENSQHSFLFNVVWSLQMPLFILISGYVTRYSMAVITIKELGALIKKRTIAYLLPQGFRMKKSRKFVENDRAKKIIIKRTTKTFCFHAKFHLAV